MAGPGDPARTSARNPRGKKTCVNRNFAACHPCALVLEGQGLPLPADADALRVAEWRPACRGNQRIGPQARGAAVGAAALLRRGLNRSAVGKTEVSITSRRLQQPAPSTLSSLLTCTDALCRAILGHGYDWRRSRPASSLRGRPVRFLKRPPCPSIQSTLKQKLCPSRLRPPRLHPQGRRGLR